LSVRAYLSEHLVQLHISFVLPNFLSEILILATYLIRRQIYLLY